MTRLRALAHSTGSVLRVGTVLLLAAVIGYIGAIFPATFAAALIGPIERPRWWVAAIIAALPYLGLAGFLTIRRRRRREGQNRLLFAAYLAALVSAAGSSSLFFLATLDSQF